MNIKGFATNDQVTAKRPTVKKLAIAEVIGLLDSSFDEKRKFRTHDMSNVRYDISALNGDQKQAVDYTLRFLDTQSISMVLYGAAGTGKSYTMKYLLDILERKYTVFLATPTHKAKEVLSTFTSREVSTLHSILGLALGTDLEGFDIDNIKFDSKKEPTIGDCNILICDEASMINKDLLNLLLSAAKDTSTKIVFVGDPVQLAPVGEDFSLVFKAKNQVGLNTLVRQKPSNPLIGWLTCFRHDIQMSQDSFNAIKTVADNIEGFNIHKEGLLNAAQTGVSGMFALNNIGSLHTEEFGGLIMYDNVMDFSDSILRVFGSAISAKEYNTGKIVGFTNKTVRGYNLAVRKHIFGNTKTNPFVIGDFMTAYRSIGEAQRGGMKILNSMDYIVVGATPDVKEYELLNHNKEVVKHNIPVYVVELAPVKSGARTTVTIAYDPTIEYTAFKNVHAFYLDRARKWKYWSDYYNFKENCLLIDDLKRLVKNSDLPEKDIDYGYGITVHKSQGSTYQHCYAIGPDIRSAAEITMAMEAKANGGRITPNIEWRAKMFMNRLFYVALSRASHTTHVLW